MLIPTMPDYPLGKDAIIDLLKAHEPFVPNWDTPAASPADALDCRAGLWLDAQFPDAEKLLETAYFDFLRFCREAGLCGNAIAVKTLLSAGMKPEAYHLAIGGTITLEAGDTEGIRRGVYFLMDLLSANCRLVKREYRRAPWLLDRISRCFFGPIKRPPYNTDELTDTVNYYPDEYLSRLAREGINGLWLTVEFREICRTSLLPEAPDAAQRRQKLRETVARCRRYGIKIWIFCIEPICWSTAYHNPLPPGAEELAGPGYTLAEAGFETNTFCPKSEKARRYLYEATHSLFGDVPHLGGLITISYGERMTSCLSRLNPFGDAKLPCPDCRLNIGDVFARLLEPMKEGMLEANPEARLISWLYLPYPGEYSSWIYQLPEKLHDSRIAIAFNFESGVSKVQIDKVHTGGDYWLSEPGPSKRFERMAQAVQKHCAMAAKLQVACSHELATLPEIPAPGLIYRKFRAMKRAGVTQAILCWYFGNFPGVMNSAAGRLAFEDFTQSEEEFLLDLAKRFYGKDAGKFAQAWGDFTAAYQNYPLDCQFQYYGMMHDAVVWPLYLKFALLPLNRTWMPEKYPEGDAVGECLGSFELREVLELFRRMKELYARGMAHLSGVAWERFSLDRSLIEAFGIHIASTYNILRFYALRNALAAIPADANTMLAELKQIVRAEIANSSRMGELCEVDPRLGYHSEAETYKYFPAKLCWRIQLLQELLERDFPEAEKVLAQGEPISGWLTDNARCVMPDCEVGSTMVKWQFGAEDEFIRLDVELPKKFDCPEAIVVFAMDFKAEKKLWYYEQFAKTAADERADGWHKTVRIARAQLEYAQKFRIGVERLVYNNDVFPESFCAKSAQFDYDPRLNLIYASPDKTHPVALE